jgi:pyrrolidone-carboxylate peptidase
VLQPPAKELHEQLQHQIITQEGKNPEAAYFSQMPLQQMYDPLGQSAKIASMFTTNGTKLAEVS